MDLAREQQTSAARAPRARLKLRTLRLSDYPQIQRMMSKIYTGIQGEFGGPLPRDKFESMLSRFPDGQIGIEDGGQLIAAAFSLVVTYDRYGDRHSYAQITGNAYFTTHEPDGDVLYGADVFVDPEHRSMRLGRRLYDARKQICRELNLRAIVAGGRIPGYHDHADKLTPGQYVDQVRRKKLHDPILSFQLANDFRVRRIIRGYLEGDDESRGFATLIEWENVAYVPRPTSVVETRKTVARIGAVQWQMRNVHSVQELIDQVEFFVDAVSDYEADFIVLPELFNVALMNLVDQSNAAAAMRAMAQFSPEVVSALGAMALKYNINIVGGSLPMLEADKLYNVAYLFRRDGSVGTQRKLHITPTERRLWSLDGGDALATFDTDAGRIGILICYDVEFPELARLLSDRGMQILFVPFWTETKNGYQRVRHCAQARAIENECYVVLSGSVGNLPKVDNVNVHYAQIAMFSPADFSFPHDAVIAESTPNTETMLIADVDLNKLKELREAGGVRNFHDRRRDLYRLDWIGPSAS